MTPASGDQDIVVLRGARTPFGDFGSALKDLGAVDLGAHAARAALERGGVDPDRVEHAVFGCVLQASGEDAYLARHVALKAGCPSACRGSPSTGSAGRACRPWSRRPS